MLKIRLQRLGRKNDPHFKLIVTQHTLKSKTHKFTEDLGYYDVKVGKYEFKGERVKYWMGVGAQVTPTVHNLLVSAKIIDAKKVNVLPRKSPTVAKKDLKKK